MCSLAAIEELYVATSTALPKRQDLPQEYTWNLESIYPNNEQWEADFAHAESRLPELQALAGTLAHGPEAFLYAIQRIQETEMLIEQLFVYARMRRDEDTANPIYQGLAERVSTLYTRFGSVTAFFAPEVLSLSDEQIEEYLAANTDLRLYTHFLSELRRQRPHIRSGEVEAVLAEAGGGKRTANTNFSMI